MLASAQFALLVTLGQHTSERCAALTHTCALTLLPRSRCPSKHEEKKLVSCEVGALKTGHLCAWKESGFWNFWSLKCPELKGSQPNCIYNKTESEGHRVVKKRLIFEASECGWPKDFRKDTISIAKRTEQDNEKAAAAEKDAEHSEAEIEEAAASEKKRAAEAKKEAEREAAVLSAAAGARRQKSRQEAAKREAEEQTKLVLQKSQEEVDLQKRRTAFQNKIREEEEESEAEQKTEQLAKEASEEALIKSEETAAAKLTTQKQAEVLEREEEVTEQAKLEAAKQVKLANQRLSVEDEDEDLSEASLGSSLEEERENELEQRNENKNENRNSRWHASANSDDPQSVAPNKQTSNGSSTQKHSSYHVTGGVRSFLRGVIWLYMLWMLSMLFFAVFACWHVARYGSCPHIYKTLSTACKCGDLQLCGMCERHFSKLPEKGEKGKGGSGSVPEPVEAQDVSNANTNANTNDDVEKKKRMVGSGRQGAASHTPMPSSGSVDYDGHNPVTAV